jgi:hypothetical protein
MTQIELQVRRARRRLTLQRFIYTLCWSWFAAMLVAAAMLIVDRYWPMGIVAWQWCVSAATLGLIVASVITLVKGDRLIDAAAEIDRRYELDERISSALALGPDELTTPAGQALANDATRRVERLVIGERFGLQLGRWAFAPVVSAAVAVLLALFLPPLAIDNQAQANLTSQQEKEQVKKSTEQLRKQLEDRKQQAEQKGLKDAEDLFGKLERALREANEAGKADRKESLVKLNDLAKQLEQRRQELNGAEQFKQQLEQLKQMQQGPADRMLEALKKGDLNKAQAELNKLADKLAKGELDEKAREDLAKQLEQMQQKLNAAADAQQKALDDLQKKIDEAKAAGKGDEAEKLQQQLEQQKQKMPTPGAMRQMADKLAKAANAAKNDQGQEAADQLKQVGDQLGQMKEQLEEGEMLDAAMDQIADAKKQMCECEGQGNGDQGKPGDGQGKKQGQGMGDGLGKGQGKGFRPEQTGDTSSYDTQVRQKVGKGSALVTGFVDGPNAKGKVEAQIKTEWESAKGDQSDPIADQPLPRNYRDHAKRYFDSLRTGK